MAAYMDLKGTSELSFFVGLGSSSVQLKRSNDGGDSYLEILNKAGNAYLDLKAGDLYGGVAYLRGDSITLNSEGTGAPNDFLMSFARPSAGMTGDVTYTFPIAPIDGYFLTTDASGNLSWAEISSPSVTEKVTVDSTSFTFSSFGSTLSMFNLPANAVIHDVQVIVDSAFDSGTFEVGILGETDRYMAQSQNDLTEDDRYVSSPNYLPSVSTEAIIGTFSGSPTQGSGRVLVFYSIPA